MTNHPDEAPKLSLLPFLIGDLALIAAAAVIATRSPAPIGPIPLLAITICVVFGAALLVVPYLANYARRQHAELDERQHQIAALARTTAESAEQLSIAAAGLHGIAQTSKENLEALEKLPAALQARIAGITQQLAGAAPASHGALKDDLAQLEASVEKISRALAKLDTAAKAKTDTLAAHDQEIASALARASARIDAWAADAAARLDRAHTPPPAPEDHEPKPKASPKTKSRPPAQLSEQPSAQPPAQPAAPSEPPAISPVSIVAAAVPVSPEPPASNPAPAEIAPASVDVAPPPSPELTPSPTSPVEAASFAPAEPAHEEVPVDEPTPAKPPRARKKSTDDDAFDLGLVSDSQGVAETAVTSDGFTRLIATAYIGIGNRLFIRGEGPGLSWEKGVPLQFVSIGKWRWETADASAPISVKLYKNDQVECLGLGKLTLEPGHQHEVNAGF